MSEEPKAILPAYVDSTMMTCARNCLQKFYDEFCFGLRPARISLDLHAGGALAYALEKYHRCVWDDGKPHDEALALAHGAFVRYWGDFPTDGTEAKTPARVWEALEDYIATYPPLMDHVQPYKVNGKATAEFSFAIPLDFPNFPRHPVTDEPFLYTGRADLFGTYKGRPCIRDEKTAGKLDSHWTEKWDLRAQFTGYCWAAQQSGIDCDTVVVRGIIIYKAQRPRQVEAIKFYPRWQIDRWLEVTRRTLWDIVEAWNDNYWRYDLGDACTQYGSCPFMPLCTVPDDQRDAWRANYPVRRWNPLTKDPLDQSSQSAPTVPSGTKLVTSLDNVLTEPVSGE